MKLIEIQDRVKIKQTMAVIIVCLNRNQDFSIDSSSSSCRNKVNHNDRNIERIREGDFKDTLVSN